MIYSVGQIVFDYIFHVRNFPKTNSTTYIQSYDGFFGGAAGNFAVVCSKLGEKASVVSFVGDDFKNSAYEKHLKKQEVDLTNLKVVEGERTARAFMFNDSKGRQSSFFFWGAASRFQNAPIPYLKLREGDVVHLANGSPEFNIRFASKYPGVSFDPGYDIVAYGRKEIQEILEKTTFLSCNEFELRKIMRLVGVREAAELFSFPLQFIVVTKGRRGSSVITPNERFDVPAVKGELVDPTGAGDSYRAAFLTAFLRGESLERCARIASAVASFVIEKHGAQTNIPTWKQALAKLNSSA
ncbi:MAG: carbohydrate kinase family protein [Candidatus Micrarchaeia archaeon]